MLIDAEMYAAQLSVYIRMCSMYCTARHGSPPGPLLCANSLRLFSCTAGGGNVIALIERAINLDCLSVCRNTQTIAPNPPMSYCIWDIFMALFICECLRTCLLR